MAQRDDIRSFFDGLAKGWDEKNQHDGAVISALLTVAACPMGGRILDVACGTGILLPHLLALEPEQLCAIDLSPEMVAIAVDKYHDPRVTVACADFYEYDRGPFDLITVYSAYPHFFDKNAFAKQAATLLKPGGRLVIAHSQSKEAINSRHRDGASPVSVPLRGGAEEAQALLPYFNMDAMVDNSRLYLLSGTRKEGAV